MNIPDLIDRFITWQSTLPCRANQETPFVDERVFQNRGVCGQAFHFLPSPPPSRTFLRSPQFSCVQEAKNASNLQKAPRKRLLRRLQTDKKSLPHRKLSKLVLRLVLCEIGYSMSIHSTQCTFHGFIKDILRKRNVRCCEFTTVANVLWARV